MSEISFAGITLSVPTPEIEDYIAASFSLRDIVQFTQTSPNVETSHWNRSGLNLDDKVQVNRLTWPVGASRWGMFHGIILEENIPTLRRKYGPQTFKMHGLTVEDAYALTPIPLQQMGSGKYQGIYLLTVVDVRYWWWQYTGVIDSQATWAALFTELSTLLGSAISHSTVDAAFLSPASDFFSHYHYLPLLLDAAAASIGRRVVMNYDGTVELLTATESLDRATANREYGLRGGGVLKPNDFSLGLPASFKLVFPRSDMGVISRDEHYAATYTPDVSIQRKLGTLRGTAVQTISSTAIAYYAGSLQNQTELDDLTDALGEAWYRWQLAPYDMAIGGIYEWDSEGMHDVYFEVANGQAITSVRRLPPENLERVGHIGTYDDVSYAWDGDSVARSQTNHGYLVAVPQNLSLTGNTTALALPDAETARITANSTWAIHGFGGGVNGKRVRVWNVGSNSFTLVHESGIATTSNRITCSTGGNITIAGNQSVEVDYQLGSARWMASIAVASNTTVNVTTSGAIRWGMADGHGAENTSLGLANRPFWSGQVIAYDSTINQWIGKEQIWMRVVTPTKNSGDDPAEQCFVATQRPVLIRSEDVDYAVNGVTRPLYTYTVGDEFVQAIAGSNGDWQELRPDGEDYGLAGTTATGTGVTSFTGDGIESGDYGLVRRGIATLGQARINVELAQTANGSAPQIENVWQSGTMNLSASFQLTVEGSGAKSGDIAFNANAAAVQSVLNSYLGGGWGTVTGNGTEVSPWVLTRGDNSTHSRLYGVPYDLHDWTGFVWVPIKSRSQTFGNVTITNGTLTLGNVSINGTVSITPGNNTITVPFVPGDFVGWGEVTASNLSASGWVYSWQNARPASVNAFYHSGGGGTMNNGTLWERNNFEIPVGEHVRVYYAEQTNGSISVINPGPLEWTAIVVGGSGSFTFAVNNGTVTNTTGAIALGANATTVKTALDALAVVSNSTISGSGTYASPYSLIMAPGDTISNITGYANLTAIQSYVCEYETYSNYGPGAPNLSVQIRSANGTQFQGLANMTGNTSLGLPVFPTFTSLRMIATDANGIAMDSAFNSTLMAFSGVNRTYTLGTNGTTATMRYVSNITCDNGTLSVTYMNATFVKGLYFGSA